MHLQSLEGGKYCLITLKKSPKNRLKVMKYCSVRVVSQYLASQNVQVICFLTILCLAQNLSSNM